MKTRIVIILAVITICYGCCRNDVKESKPCPQKCTAEQRVNNTGCCADVILVTRKEWGARPTRSSSPLLLPIPYVFIHHTADTGENLTSDAAKVREIQDFHMDVRGWDDIGYSFLVGADGRVYEGRGWERVGAHTYGYNTNGIGISIIGNFMDHLPNPAQLRATKDMINCGENNGVLNSSYLIFGHRDARATDCPGDILYERIETWERYGTNITLHHY